MISLRATAVTLAGLLAASSVLFSSALAVEKPGPVLKIVNPPALYNPAPYGYSHAIVSHGSGRIAFIAGQGGEDAKGKLSPRFADQVRQAYANLQTALDAVGAKPNQVGKLTTYVVGYDPSKLPAMTKHLKQMFGDALPTQSLVPVPRLALDGMLFEVDAFVVLD